MTDKISQPYKIITYATVTISNTGHKHHIRRRYTNNANEQDPLNKLQTNKQTNKQD